MEPIFSNACKYTLDNLMQMSKSALPSWYRGYCGVFSAVFIVLSAYSFYMEDIFKGAVFILFAAALVAVYYAKTTLAAKKHYKSNMELYGEEAETRIFFYDDCIIGKNMNTGKSVKTTYDKIDRIVETKNLYILNMLGNVSILVDKNGFISDNSPEFVEFMRQKCAKV